MPKKINLKGAIISNSNKEVYEFYGIEATCPKDIVDELPQDGSDVELIVNSNGGLVTMGSEIFTELKSYSGDVTAKVVGMAASAASVAIMGASKVEISPTAQIMIHKAAFRWISGNSDDLKNAANALDSSDKAICNAYKLKTGMSDEELLTMMRNETFMSAEVAVEKKFADSIMFGESNDSAPDLVASFNSGLLPEEVVNKFYQDKNHEKERQEILNDLEKQQLLMEL